MAGTPSTHPRLIKDYLQPKKFLRDMRARVKKNSHSRTTGRQSAR